MGADRLAEITQISQNLSVQFVYPSQKVKDFWRLCPRAINIPAEKYSMRVLHTRSWEIRASFSWNALGRGQSFENRFFCRDTPDVRTKTNLVTEQIFVYHPLLKYDTTDHVHTHRRRNFCIINNSKKPITEQKAAGLDNK